MSKQFFSLTQEKIVEEYREKFENLVENLKPLSEMILEGNFKKGLKSEIRSAVKVMRPRDLRETVELV